MNIDEVIDIIEEKRENELLIAYDTYQMRLQSVVEAYMLEQESINRRYDRYIEKAKQETSNDNY